MRNKLIVLLLCLCVAPVFGQEVVFNISPRNAFVRINGEVLDLSKQQKITLEEGTYVVEIWAPNFEVVTKSIVVEVGKNQVVNFGLKKQAQAFLDYREELSEFKTAKLKRSLSGGTLVAAITETRSDITITFTSSWLDATPEQRSTITGLRINGPRTDRVFFYPPETTSHVLEFERHDLRRCLDFTFTTVDDTNTRTTELCFNP